MKCERIEAKTVVICSRMPDALKTYAKVLARHHRIMIFVDSGISESSLRNIIEANLHIWGGRYNPIVPVRNNVIAKEWLDIIKYFDPDFIYYSKIIDLKILESLNLFHPCEYIEIRDDGRYYFPGVNIHCLIHEQIHSRFLTNKSVLLQYDGDWDMGIKAKEFYQLNIGFRPFYDGEKKWTSKLEAIGVNEANAGEINKLIYTQRPYFKSLLSSLHINSVCIDGNKSWHDSRFEWIIYKKSNSQNDLLYFWNRQLYFEPKNFLTQVVSTIEEVEELLKDQWFAALLSHLCIENQISLVSQSVSADKMKEFREKMQFICDNVRIEYKDIRPFPFEPKSIKYFKGSYFKPINNLILGESDFLKFPNIIFESGRTIDSGPYALDIVIEKDTKEEHKEIKFPYDTEIHFIVCKEPSRINKEHHVTIFTNREKQGADFSIPSDFELIRSILMCRKKHKELLTLPVDYITPSPAGQKLSAFFRLFQNDWSTIKQFLEEKFWLQLFRYSSEVKESNIPAGKGVFSYEDLVKEINGLYTTYRTEITNKMREAPSQEFEEEFVNRYIERCIKEAFAYHIDSDLNYLIDRSALFVGMKVKCQQCGSNKWYSLTELRDRLPCKGCNSEVIPSLRSKVYYKLSDTVINNLLSDQTKNQKDYDGNYVVLKTILHLKEDFKESGNSFLWTPCLDFSRRNGENLITSDLDIVALQDGELVIGEAKCNAKEFNKKVKNSLIWAGNYLMPDKIIVSCDTGDLSNVVKEIQDGLTNKICRVVAYKTFPAWYHLPGIFGEGIPKNQLTQ